MNRRIATAAVMVLAQVAVTVMIFWVAHAPAEDSFANLKFLPPIFISSGIELVAFIVMLVTVRKRTFIIPALVGAAFMFSPYVIMLTGSQPVFFTPFGTVLNILSVIAAVLVAALYLRAPADKEQRV